MLVVMAIKGGTGKSLSTINIATMLARDYKVGMLDADVDSPNLPKMLRIDATMEMLPDHTFVPADYKGIKVVSTGLFQKGIFTVFKTGREVEQIVADMLNRSQWGDTEVLVVDQPAGSDSELRAIIDSGFPLLGVVIVSQPTTYDDCWRCIEICTRFSLHVIGIIENMAGAAWPDGTPVIHPATGLPFIPFGNPNDGHQIEKLATDTGIEYLGRIPLMHDMYSRIASGDPTLPDSLLAPYTKAVNQVYANLPRRVTQ
jgi:Mrp family chromosome partitioning ATPase